MASTAYDHKLTEYPKKKYFNKLSQGSTFFNYNGNHEFYNGTKAENV